MTDPKYLNANDFSDSDWYEFTGGLQRPFTSQEQQDAWVTVNGRLLPDNAHELEAWWTEANRPLTPEELEGVAKRRAEFYAKRGKVDPQLKQ